jgi:hypothetical protein
MATRLDYEKRASLYYNAYYKQLEGATIERFIGMEDDEFNSRAFPKFAIRYPNGTLEEVMVSQDEEGNGGGFLFLPYEPDMDAYDRKHKLNHYEEKTK